MKEKEKKLLKVTISNPEVLEKASEKFTALLYEMYLKSLSKKQKEE